MATTFSGNAAIYTIGCRLNQADSSLVCDRLTRDGWNIVEMESGSDLNLIIINSCSVTGTASQKSRQAARKFRRLYPSACIVVTGCSAEVESEFWAGEDSVDIVLANPQKKELAEHVRTFFEDQRQMSGMLKFSSSEPPDVFMENAESSFPFKSRAFLKIQEGCNNFCSYCIVPYTRGRERSRAWDEVIADFKHQLDSGFQEIVLAGVNVCAYNDHGRRLPDLLNKLTGFDGQFRIRLSSTEPHPDNMELLAVMAGNPKICRFLHLSLQHGTDEILGAMNRKYTAAGYADFVRAARSMIPGIHLGTDIIVGFPGETDELFSKECEFVRQMAFANVHIFTFSPRKGTPAATLSDQVKPEIARQRYKQLMEITDASSAEFISSQLHQKLNVIFESRDKQGRFTGWSDNYVSVRCGTSGIKPHEITGVIAARVIPGGIEAEIPC
ncbi:MAG: tRNA (N(6)-L-threonylcarbamoyladenosine(37)-C(2))-methylthiotransferase MtaB [Victivallaceae bacterium]|jgi:threonylcarbamoyladenosine tRNA methylthiotransferase MtaB